MVEIYLELLFLPPMLILLSSLEILELVSTDVPEIT